MVVRLSKSKSDVLSPLMLMQVTARPDGEDRNAALAAALSSNVRDSGLSRKEQQQAPKRKKGTVKRVRHAWQRSVKHCQ